MSIYNKKRTARSRLNESETAIGADRSTENGQSSGSLYGEDVSLLPSWVEGDSSSLSPSWFAGKNDGASKKEEKSSIWFEANNNDTPEKEEKSSSILEKIIGGPDPFDAKPSGGLGKPQVPDVEEDVSNIGGASDTENVFGDTRSGTGVTDAEVDEYMEALRSILDPNYSARASEDVMGQYATMTGGRPSSAAISAGTAAGADAEAALLREILAAEDRDRESGTTKENTTVKAPDGDDKYADWAGDLLDGYEGYMTEDEVEHLVSYMPSFMQEVKEAYPSDYAYRVYYLIQMMYDNRNITESTYNRLLRQAGMADLLGYKED